MKRWILLSFAASSACNTSDGIHVVPHAHVESAACPVNAPCCPVTLCEPTDECDSNSQCPSGDMCHVGRCNSPSSDTSTCSQVVSSGYKLCSGSCCGPTGVANATTTCDVNGSPCGWQCSSGYKQCASSCIANSECCGSAPAAPVCNKMICSNGNWVPTPDVEGGFCNGSPNSKCVAHSACHNGTCTDYPAPPACTAGTCDASATCNPSTGGCTKTPKENGTACGGAGCFVAASTCLSGVCQAAVVQDCNAGVPQCKVGSCDAGNGVCVADNKDDGTPCTLTDPCVATAACSAGECVGTTKDCSALNGPCTVGQCEAATGNCIAVPTPGVDCVAPDAGVCDDGGTCNAVGTCVPKPKDCSSADDLCGKGVCDPNFGACVTETLAEGTVCDPKDICLLGGMCTQGDCKAMPKCQPDNECRIALCDANDGKCSQTDKPDGTTCALASCLTAICDHGTCACSDVRPGDLEVRESARRLTRACSQADGVWWVFVLLFVLKRRRLSASIPR